MSRLIYAEDVKALINGLDSLPFEEEVDDLVDRIPTAFDVDKVISNIWDKSELIHIKHNCYDEVEDYIKTTDASEIVKAGGIDVES